MNHRTIDTRFALVYSLRAVQPLLYLKTQLTTTIGTLGIRNKQIQSSLQNCIARFKLSTLLRRFATAG